MFQNQTEILSDGVQLNVAKAGNKAPIILFIHGLSNSWQVWAGCMGYLSQHATCVAIDLPGCGASPDWSKPYTMTNYAEIAIKYISEKIGRSVIVCGHSMGGQVAAIMALQSSSWISKLILLAPAGVEKYTLQEQLIMQWSSLAPTAELYNVDWLGKALEMSFFKSTETSKKLTTFLTDVYTKKNKSTYHKMLTECIQNMMRENISNRISGIKCPTLIVFGKNDELIPNKWLHSGTSESIAIQMQKDIPMAQLLMLEECGHFLHVEKAKEVSSVIEHFTR